ncbi:MAG: hypothetical protein R3E96_09900 [Planctomycetota bacterium]
MQRARIGWLTRSLELRDVWVHDPLGGLEVELASVRLGFDLSLAGGVHLSQALVRGGHATLSPEAVERLRSREASQEDRPSGPATPPSRWPRVQVLDVGLEWIEAERGYNLGNLFIEQGPPKGTRSPRRTGCCRRAPARRARAPGRACACSARGPMRALR